MSRCCGAASRAPFGCLRVRWNPPGSGRTSSAGRGASGVNSAACLEPDLRSRRWLGWEPMVESVGFPAGPSQRRTSDEPRVPGTKWLFQRRRSQSRRPAVVGPRPGSSRPHPAAAATDVARPSCRTGCAAPAVGTRVVKPLRSPDRPGTSRSCDRPGTSRSCDRPGTSRSCDRPGTSRSCDRPGTSRSRSRLIAS